MLCLVFLLLDSDFECSLVNYGHVFKVLKLDIIQLIWYQIQDLRAHWPEHIAKQLIWARENMMTKQSLDKLQHKDSVLLLLFQELISIFESDLIKLFLKRHFGNNYFHEIEVELLFVLKKP